MNALIKRLADLFHHRYVSALSPFFVLFVVSIVVTYLVMSISARSLDENELSRSKHLAQAALEGENQKLVRLALDYSWWNEFYDNIIVDLNLDFADANIGSYFTDNYDIKAAFVLTKDDQLAVGFVDGEIVEDDAFLRRLGVGLAELTARTRRTPTESPKPAHGLLARGDDILLVAVSVVTPEAESSPARMRTVANGVNRPVLIVMRALDKALVNEIGATFLLPSLALHHGQDGRLEGGILLSSVDGAMLGRLIWAPSNSGSALGSRLMPLVVLMLAFMTLLGVMFVLSTRREIAEKEQLHQEVSDSRDRLRVSEERLLLAFQGANDGMWDWNFKTGVFFAGAGMTTIAGLENCYGTLSPSDVYELVHPDDRPIYRKAVIDHLKNRTSHLRVEYRMNLRDDKSIWVLNRGLAIRDETGWAYRMSGSITDITEQKQNELALIQARQRADQANLAKSAFLAHMSHEFRTPLNAIIGFSEIMAEEIFGPHGAPKYREYSHDILHSSRHLLDVIGDILDLSKIEADELELDLQVTDIRGPIGSSARLLNEVAVEKGLHLSCRMPEEAMMVDCDMRAIRQVVLNILSNAMKFTGRGGNVDVKVEPTSDNCLILSITDTGCGISPHDIDRVLEPFGQGRTGQNISHEGTGLGLAISKRLVEMHGGRLKIQSEVGVGTEIIITLPLIDGPVRLAS